MSIPIRVLCVMSTLGRGGAETMVMNLFRNIDRDSVVFDFVKHSHGKDAYEDEITALGGKIYEAPRYKIYNHLSYQKWWKKFFPNHPEYKIVHIHYFTLSGIICPIAKAYDVKTITHAHTSRADSFLKKILNHNIRNVTDYYFACSKEAGIYLFGENKIHSKNFKVLPNAIDTEKYRYNESVREKARNSFSIIDELLIGHIGNFTEVKNHRFILKIFSSLREKKKDVKLMLVGDGPLRGEIEKYAEELGVLDDVIFMGVRSDVNELVQAMDFFVFPSLFEGLGIVAIEAQTSGLPCIISDTVPDEAIVTKNLVTVMSLNESAEKWADCIIARLEEKRYSRVDEIKAKGYDVSETAKWLEEFYLSINNQTEEINGTKSSCS